jgi:hypothetical protein
MIYDEKISMEVSLSKILDYFLESGEEPSSVVNFLNLYQTRIGEVYEHSHLFARIGRLDFASRLRHDELEWLLTMWLQKNSIYAARLVWQILCSDANGITKRLARKFVGEIRFPHPHTGYTGRIARILDGLISKWGFSVFEMAERLNEIGFRDYCLYMGSVGSSVFIDGMLQSDFFNCLDAKRQWVFLSNVLESDVDSVTLENFFFQILSEEHPVEMKLQLVKKLQKSSIRHYSLQNKDLMKKVKTAGNWPEVAVWCQLMGIEDIFDELIFNLLKNDNRKMLFSILDNEPDLFRNSYDIIDVLEKMRKENGKGKVV